MAIRVECYAGYRGDQEPIAFWLDERRLAVRGIVDRWFAPTQRWFKVASLLLIATAPTPPSGPIVCPLQALDVEPHHAHHGLHHPLRLLGGRRRPHSGDAGHDQRHRRWRVPRHAVTGVLPIVLR